MLLDTYPYSIGIETAGGVINTSIRRNTVVPCKKSQTFSTLFNNQSGILLKVFEGKRAMTKDNTLLKRIYFCGVPLIPRGVLLINIFIEMDSYGAIGVSAAINAVDKI